MKPEVAERICHLLQSKGIDSVHIGGGEPFLDFDALIEVVKVIHRSGIEIDYIETNGFWACEEEKAFRYLNTLKQAGVGTIFTSVDPFHAEYIPFGLPLRLIEMCEDTGLKYIVWKKEFVETLAKLDPERTYSRDELEKHISPNYLPDTVRAYGIMPTSCRAINIEYEYASRHVPIAELIATSHACRCLLTTSHFHIDLYENFVPISCSGVSIPAAEAFGGVSKGRYPVFEALVTSGVGGLAGLAEERGFELEGEYPSHCALCFHIRHLLSETNEYKELDLEFYEATLR